MIQTQSDGTLRVLPCSPTTTTTVTTTTDMITLGFADPSSSMTPGWPLRNILAWAYHKFKSHSFQVVCYRESPSKSNALDSIVIHTELPLDATFLQQNQINGKYIYMKEKKKLWGDDDNDDDDGSFRVN